MSRALVALMLLFTAGCAETAHSAKHQPAPTTAASTPAPAPSAHRAVVRAHRSLKRAPLAVKKIRRPAVVPAPKVTYLPVVMCWDGSRVVDHNDQLDCPARPKSKPTPKAAEVRSSGSVYDFVASLPAPWPAIVHCESLRDDSWHTYSHSMARGLFQFLRSTWARMGGSGDPAAASWDEQFAMARKLARLEGLRSWDCARMLGVA